MEQSNAGQFFGPRVLISHFFFNYKIALKDFISNFKCLKNLHLNIFVLFSEYYCEEFVFFSKETQSSGKSIVLFQEYTIAEVLLLRTNILPGRIIFLCT